MKTINSKTILLSPQVSELIKIKTTLLTTASGKNKGEIGPPSSNLEVSENSPAPLRLLSNLNFAPKGGKGKNNPLGIRSYSHRQCLKLTISGPLGVQSIIIPEYFSLRAKVFDNTNENFKAITSIEVSDSGNLCHKLTSKFKIEVKSLLSQINKMVIGVTEGYTKKIRLVGIGYKLNYDNKPNLGPTITLNIGFSHPVIITNIPSNISVSESAIRENKADPSALELYSTSLIDLNNFINSIVKIRPIKKSFKGTGMFFDPQR
jgi:ribosomal protein L6P/L9E